MSAVHNRLKRALERNLAELSNCILKRRAYNKFIVQKSSHSLDFFRICVHALYNDMFADAHRALDRHKDAASFWYIKNIAPESFSKAAKESGIDTKRLDELTKKLNHIRDRTHFHIDKRNVIKPSEVWVEADITGDEFIYLTENAHEILRCMYLELTGNDNCVPDYNGEDIEKILRTYK